MNFPANYRLRTQVLKGEVGAKRMDPFLYGHPGGAKERFRSPAEFALHLLWLLSDSVSYEDCSCQLCKKMVREVARKAASAVQVKNPSQPSGATLAPTMPPGAAPGAAPGPAASRGNAPAPSYNSPGGDSVVFRVGELAWYKKGTAWRLGIVAWVGAPGPDHLRQQHQIAPLGHVSLKQESIVKEASDMRPFLGFSIPKPNAQLENMRYENVNWPHVAASWPNAEVVGLEASKLAAAAINGSFSFFNRQQSISPTQHTFGGVFLGAEQVRVGDALRVQSPGGPDTKQDVMSVRLIYSDGDGVAFLGNTYRAAPGTAAAAGAEPQPTGRVFVEEMRMHEEVTGRPWHWQPQETDAVRKELQVCGRFYVTDRLMPLLKAEEYAAGRARGDAVDGAEHLNRRFQTSAAVYVGRKPTRNATIGAAIMAPVALGEGIVEEVAAVG